MHAGINGLCYRGNRLVQEKCVTKKFELFGTRWLINRVKLGYLIIGNRLVQVKFDFSDI